AAVHRSRRSTRLADRFQRAERHHLPSKSRAGSSGEPQLGCGRRSSGRLHPSARWHSINPSLVLRWQPMRTLLPVLLLASAAFAQVRNYKPVTKEMLENPSPNDWLMFSRTYDAQRFSPLNQITKQNVTQLRLAWSRGLPAGQTEAIPLVYNG